MKVTSLKAYLAEIGMSMTDFAKLVHYNPRYLSHVADGKMSPSERLSKYIFNATNGIINLPTQPKSKKSKKTDDVKNHDMNLKAYLANVRMTMTQFCEKIDCNRNHLSSICSGRIPAGRRLARHIFEATGGVVNLATRPKREKVTKPIIEEINLIEQ